MIDPDELVGVDDGTGVAAALVAPSRLTLLRAFEDATSELTEALVLLEACAVRDSRRLPVGCVDRLLLHAHRIVVGHDLEAVVGCPSCGTLTALPLGPQDVPAYAPRTAWSGPGAGTREPTAADLLDLPDDPDAAADTLERRCRVGPADTRRDPDALDRAEQSLCGPVHVSCPECAGPVSEHVDVQHLVTTAVAQAVADVDVEVHLIASRYGWELATIEGLSEARRVRLAALAAGVPA